MIDHEKVRRRLLALPIGVPGYLRALRGLKSRSIAIVMYHGVSAIPLPVFNWCHVDSAEFEKQIDFLASEYTVLHLSEVVERMKNGRPLPRATACVTFDDGLRNVVTTAFPILERRQVPATVFLVTSLVGTNQPPWTEKLYFSLVQTPRQSVRFDKYEYLLTTAKQLRVPSRRWKLGSRNRRKARKRSCWRSCGKRSAGPRFRLNHRWP